MLTSTYNVHVHVYTCTCTCTYNIIAAIFLVFPIARFFFGSAEEKKLQHVFVLRLTGLLTSVGNLKAENSSTSITISWSAPFSLDVSGVDPDIWYTVLISNVTDEDHPTDVSCADCHNLTQTHYTFSPDLPSPCHKYKYTFTVTPQNGVGNGMGSQPVTGNIAS